MIVVSRIQIELDSGGGEIHFAMPYSMLEPIREQLDAGMSSDRTEEVDDRWIRSLHDEIKGAEVEISSVLAEQQLSIADVINMKPGDIIPFEMPEEVTIFAEKIAILRGSVGVSNDQVALKILGHATRTKEKDTLEIARRRK